MPTYPITQKEYNWRQCIGESIVTDQFILFHTESDTLPNRELVTLFVQEELDQIFYITEEK